jgi:hypothetical protein
MPHILDKIPKVAATLVRDGVYTLYKNKEKDNYILDTNSGYYFLIDSKGDSRPLNVQTIDFEGYERMTMIDGLSYSRNTPEIKVKL